MTLTFSISRDTILGFAKNYGGLPWWDAVLCDPVESSSGLLYRCLLESPFTNQGSSFLPSPATQLNPKTKSRPCRHFRHGPQGQYSCNFNNFCAKLLQGIWPEWLNFAPSDPGTFSERKFLSLIFVLLWYRAHFSWHFCAQVQYGLKCQTYINFIQV